MNAREIVLARLYNQGIATAPFQAPEDVVGWLGAVQSQEQVVAQWSVGLRAHDAHEHDVDAALAEGRILRTHVLRPTWHYVLPADISWLLQLTAPRVRRLMSYYDRLLELDETVFARSNAAIARALAGGNHLTRTEVSAVLGESGIEARGQRLGQLLLRAELEALVCSGAARGRQQTYALLAERAPGTKTLTRDEALAELAVRYFTSHGPATLNDLQWWSSLTAADARRAVELAGSRLERTVAAGRTYWSGGTAPPVKPASTTAHLLQGFDEYFSYGVSRDIFAPPEPMQQPPDGRTPLLHALIVDGRVAGRWRRTLKRGEVKIEMQLHRDLDADEQAAVEAAAQRYASFLGVAVTSVENATGP